MKNTKRAVLVRGLRVYQQDADTRNGLHRRPADPALVAAGNLTRKSQDLGRERLIASKLKERR